MQEYSRVQCHKVRSVRFARILASRLIRRTLTSSKLYNYLLQQFFLRHSSPHGGLLNAPECATITEVKSGWRECRVTEYVIDVRRRARAGRFQLSVRGGESVAGEPSSAGSCRLELGREGLRGSGDCNGKRDFAGSQANITVPVSF